MNFIKFSVLYAYLYSPQSWLHKQNNTKKIYIFFIYLICLPYMPIKYICFFLIGLVYMYKSTYVPVQLNNYFYNITSVFMFFILINIQHKKNLIPELLIHKNYLQIYPLDNPFSSYLNYDQKYKIFPSQFYYLSKSLIRLLSINLLYLFWMKFLLLTTSYEKIIQIFLNHFKKYINSSTQRLAFEIQVAIQFLKIILKQLEVIRTAYIIRSIQLKKGPLCQNNLFIYFFCIQQLIINIYQSIYYITDTLYSREIHLLDLNIIYKK